MTETPFTTTTPALAEIAEHHTRTDAEGRLEHLRPGDLQIDTNIRDQAALDPHFVASIREHGVLQPVTAFRGPDGIVKVRDGQRRTLAAIEAGVPTIPVYIRPMSDADTTIQTANRIVHQIVHQIVANDHRAALTDAQRAKGIQQMLLAGISATKVAKLAVHRNTVDAAATAAASPVAMAALDAGQLSLQEAAALTEFNGDNRATEALLAAAGTAMFDHKVAQLRQDRIDTEAQAEAAAHYAAQGYTILEEMPQWRDPSKVALRYLRTADSHVATDEAVSNPAHWAILLVQADALVDTATGKSVEHDDVDWNTEDDPEAQPEDGLRHASTVVERTVWVPEFYCTDTEAAGLTPAEFLQNQRPIVHHSGGVDAQDAEAAAEARAEAERAERAERRKVITLNKLGLAAQEVRRRFVTDLLRRKTAPKGTVQFIATCLAQSPNLPADYQARQVLGDFLHLGDTPFKEACCDLPEGSDHRAQVLILGLLLAALEGRTPKDVAAAAAVGSQTPWRIARPLPAPIPMSHLDGGRFFLIFVADLQDDFLPGHSTVTKLSVAGVQARPKLLVGSRSLASAARHRLGVAWPAMTPYSRQNGGNSDSASGL